MNAFRKQLKLPFSGIKKAASANNLNDDSFINSDLPPIAFSHNHSKNAFPRSQDLMSLFDDQFNKGKRNSTLDGNFVEDELPNELSHQWISDLLSNDNSSSKFEKKLSSLQEFLTTELNFLRQMQFLLDVQSNVVSPMQTQLLKSIKLDDLFLNLGQIYETNYTFWTQFLYPTYKSAISNHKSISVKNWKEAFLSMSSLFQPYEFYCAHMNECQKFIQNLEKDNKYFAKFLIWFSQQGASNRESLKDFIAKPFQRLTKYSLLLSTIKRYSDDEEEIAILDEMIIYVKEFLKNLEVTMSISQISVRLDPIELVEPPTEDLNTFCTSYRNLDLMKPIKIRNTTTTRQFSMHINARLKEAQSRTIEVTCFLFTDILLICQRIKDIESDRVKIIKPIISLDKLIIDTSVNNSVILRIIDDYGILISMYVLMGESDAISRWVRDISTNKSQLRIMNTSLTTSLDSQSSLSSSLMQPLIHISCPSPYSERSTPTMSDEPKLNSLKQSNILRSHSNSTFNHSFIRNSSKLNSPIIRRRNNTLNNHKNRHESLIDPPNPRPNSEFCTPTFARCLSTTDLSSSSSLFFNGDSNLSSNVSTHLSSMDNISPSIAEEPEEMMLDNSHSSSATMKQKEYNKSDSSSASMSPVEKFKRSNLLSSKGYSSMMDLKTN